MALLVIGTEMGLHDDTPARRRALQYASMLSRYDTICYGKGGSARVSTLSDRSIATDVCHPNVFVSLFRAYKKGCEIVRREPNRQWVVSAQDPFESGLVAYFIARRTGIALHLQLHTDPDARLWKESRKNRLRDMIFRFLAPRADAFRVVSERARRAVILRKRDEKRIHVIPIVSDPAHVEPSKIHLRASYKEFGEIILGMGRLSYEKGFDVLVEAMRDVVLARPSALLLIVGSGPEEHALRRRVAQLELSGSVRFVPWVRDVAAYLKAADVIVVPSRFEGWGLLSCEAISHGKAVVMTDTGCAGEVIVHEHSGLVVPPEDADRLSEAIVRILSDKDLRTRLEAGAKISANMLVTTEKAMKLHQESWILAYQHASHIVANT